MANAISAPEAQIEVIFLMGKIITLQRHDGVYCVHVKGDRLCYRADTLTEAVAAAILRTREAG